MCLDNIRRKWQPFGKRKFAYKVVMRDENNNLVTNIARMPVRVNTEVWQGAYQRVPEHVKLWTDYGETHRGKISVFLELGDAEQWAQVKDQIWLVEINYDKLLVGEQHATGRNLQGALVDEFRLVKRIK